MHFWRSNSQQSQGAPETQSVLPATRHGRSKTRFYVLTFYLFAAVAPARAQQHQPRRIDDRETLHVADETHTYAKYGRWQVWLYQNGVRIPQYGAGLQYSRWGLLEGGSPESVIKEFRDAQRFEELYLSFFGRGTWGRQTFSNPLGPIVISHQAIENDTTALEMRSQVAGLRIRVNRLIVSALPSLENNESEGPSCPHKEYFDQIHYVGEEIARIGKVVSQAEKDLPNMAASLPTVKLPTSTTWMFHTERAGSDGTIQVQVTET